MFDCYGNDCIEFVMEYLYPWLSRYPKDIRDGLLFLDNADLIKIFTEDLMELFHDKNTINFLCRVRGTYSGSRRFREDEEERRRYYSILNEVKGYVEDVRYL